MAPPRVAGRSSRAVLLGLSAVAALAALRAGGRGSSSFSAWRQQSAPSTSGQHPSLTGALRLGRPPATPIALRRRTPPCASALGESAALEEPSETEGGAGCYIQEPSHCVGGDEAGIVDKLNAWIEKGLGSSLLVLAAVVSLVLANLPTTRVQWLALWKLQLGPSMGSHALSLKAWVNEGLMALFFFAVGLEIKKEAMEGSLASLQQAALPCIAAVGGMVVPMAVYVAVQYFLPGGSFAGVTVPMATDIAFAMGVFQVFYRHMPPAAASFLLALATVDDLGAIGVIAVCFAGALAPAFLAGAIGVLGATVLFSQKGFRSESARIFWLPALALWYCLLRGGVSADLAGVFVAFCVPMRSKGGEEIVERLIGRWSAGTALLVLPIFALANCAVSLGGSAAVGAPATSLAVPVGIVLGLLVGKPLGIFGATYCAVKVGVGKMPTGMSKRHLGIVGMLGGIGFTMCLFLVENSLRGPTARLSKLAVLGGSCLAAGLSALIMSRQPQRSEAVLAMAS